MDTQPPKLLLVDDAPLNLYLLEQSLKRDFVVSMVTSGAEALRHAALEIPDAILLDVMMPEMDGFETCRRLKADSRLRDVPVIFITALGDLQAESQGLEAGGADYIAKPFNVQSVLQRVKHHVERERLRRQLLARNAQLEEEVAARTADLQRAMEAAELASRAKSSFLALMGHELRTPMNAVTGLLDIVRRHLQAPEAIARIDRAQLAAGQLMQLLDHVLEFSDLDSSEGLQALAFTPRELIAALRMRLDQGEAGSGSAGRGDLRCCIPPVLAEKRLLGDQARLERLLATLLARMKGQGSGQPLLTLEEMAAVPDERWLGLRLVIEAGQADVEQPGCAPLFTLVTSSESFALGVGKLDPGLAVCRRILDLMGGEARLECEPGRPCRLILSLRFARPAPRVLPREGRLILLVEDDALDREIELDLLGQLPGAQVTVAESGPAMLARLQEEDFDALLVNARLLAEWGGALQEGRPAGRRLPPLLLMSHDEAHSITRSSSGAQAFILQPLEPERFFAVLGELLQMPVEGGSSLPALASLKPEQPLGREA